MLGKKKWYGATNRDPLAHAPPQGDVKLYHLSNLHVQAEADSASRRLRITPHRELRTPEGGGRIQDSVDDY